MGFAACLDEDEPEDSDDFVMVGENSRQMDIQIGRSRRMARTSTKNQLITSRRYKSVDTTKEMCETFYYELKLTDATRTLVEPNQFWEDYAAFEGKGPFLSSV
jgi:hypothetical protein